MFLVYIIFWFLRNCISASDDIGNFNTANEIDRKVKTVASNYISSYGFKRVTADYARKTMRELSEASFNIREVTIGNMDRNSG